MAMTTVYPDGAKGAAIQEADIELNGRVLRGFDGKLALDAGTLDAGSWAPPGAIVFAVPGSTGDVTLKSVLVHELGHVLGLTDLCAPSHQTVQTGSALPCPADFRERVMFAPARLTNPSEGEVRELCRLHAPRPMTTGTLTHAEDTAPESTEPLGCSPVVAVILLLLAGGAIAFLRRRRSKKLERKPDPVAAVRR